MIAELSPRIHQIAEIFEPSQPASSSKLTNLSGLNRDELKFLQEVWAKAEITRRRQVISQLVHLSEVDGKLDFSGTFAFCIHDPDEVVRTQTIAGLEIEENYQVIKPLLSALKDSSAEVRAVAARALGKFALLAELGKLSDSFKDSIYSTLLETLDSKAETIEVKRRALEAISPLSLPRVKELIEQAYRTGDVKQKASAIYAMGRNCDPAWLTILLTELESNETEIRYEAANASGQLGDEKAVPHLLRLTKDEDNQVQETAIKALGDIGGDQAKEALNKLGKDPQARIRRAAKSALEEIDFCEDPLSSQY